jgi:hypothetical protein
MKVEEVSLRINTKWLVGKTGRLNVITIKLPDSFYRFSYLYIILCFFFKLVGWDLGTAATYWPIVPAPGNSDGDCGEIGGKKIGPKKIEVLGENLPQRHFVHHKSHTWLDSDLNPSRRGGKPATNRLSYGTALLVNSS